MDKKESTDLTDDQQWLKAMAERHLEWDEHTFGPQDVRLVREEIDSLLTIGNERYMVIKYWLKQLMKLQNDLEQGAPAHSINARIHIIISEMKIEIS